MENTSNLTFTSRKEENPATSHYLKWNVAHQTPCQSSSLQCVCAFGNSLEEVNKFAWGHKGCVCTQRECCPHSREPGGMCGQGKAILGQRMWTLLIRRQYLTKATCHLLTHYITQFCSAAFQSTTKPICILWRKLDRGHSQGHLTYLTR